MAIRSLAVMGLSGLAGLAVGACTETVKAPYDSGVCWMVEAGEEGQAPTFNKVAEGQTRIEDCAARLEETRVRFLRLGGNRREVTGAYQGQFIFIDAAGIKIGKTLDGSRFMLLARTGDGRLAVPGAIVRDENGRPVAVRALPENQ